MTELNHRPVHLAVRNLQKSFQTKDGPIHALDNISVSAQRGEFVSIVGPSGCGKSTLLKIVLGVVEPTSGEVTIDGRALQAGRAGVGMVFQSAALPPWRTVIDNVLLPIEAIGLKRKQFRERAVTLLNMAGLNGFELRYPNELSGGMQQRVAICRALIHDPPLLLMDEPFGALDALTREAMQIELMRIWDETGKTILFVTHSIDEAVLLSDRVVLMSSRPGKIARELHIGLSRPRSPDIRSDPKFQEYARELRHGLGVSSG